MDEETFNAENEDQCEEKTCFQERNEANGKINAINAGKSQKLNIIFLKNSDYCMYFQDINTILDSPPCPKIEPKDEPLPDLLDLEFQLEPQDPCPTPVFHSYKCQEDTSTQTESTEMVQEAEEEFHSCKRSYREFMGFERQRPMAIQVMAVAHRRPYKIRNL